MSLRIRLLLALVGVVAVGLVVADLVVYAELHSYLVTHVDGQLKTASFTVDKMLTFSARSAIAGQGQVKTPIPTGGATSVHRSSVESITAAGQTTTTAATHATGQPAGTTQATTPTTLPTGVIEFPTGPFSVHTHGAAPHSGLFPEGTVGELVNASGQLKGKRVSFVYDQAAPPPPALPHPLPRGATVGPVVFAVGSSGGHPLRYQVLARPLHRDGLEIVVAIPLSDVDQTLGRLRFVMMLVSVAMLAGLGILSWWIVRRGLRPLERMAGTAGQIAGGNLGLRVLPADGRSEVGRLGQALNGMLGEIETAFAARSASESRLRRFVADASHELRTPLTSIRGHAELFDLGARDRPEDLAKTMHHIREEAERMQVLVDELLLLARLGVERPLASGPVDLSEVAARAVTAVGAAAPDRQVRLGAVPTAMVRGDAHRLRQVVDNLLTNALRHSPTGAPVTVTVSVEGDRAVLVVSDRGPGVAPDEVQRVFEPFYRADASRARSTGGAGLGLAIVAAIVGAHGGTVAVEPDGSPGARFVVRLPVDGGAVPSFPEGTPGPASLLEPGPVALPELRTASPPGPAHGPVRPR